MQTIKPITRREALKRIHQALVGIGAGSLLSFEDLLAASRNKTTAPMVIWLHGTSCTGCSCSFLNIEDVPIVQLITEFMDLVFHHDLSLATGDQVVDILELAVKIPRKYLLIVEGAIPVTMPHACLLADKPISFWVEKLAHNAAACIAAGTCASFGGIPRMRGTVTGNMTLGEFLHHKQLSVPLVNLPNCPLKPEHLVYTLLYYTKFSKLPERDLNDRPLSLFNRTIHQHCIYYQDFQENNFARHIGDDGCLFHLGCQGPITNNDCMTLGHNGNTNTCIKAGHPCIGCAGVEFPRRIMYHAYDDTRYLEFEKS